MPPSRRERIETLLADDPDDAFLRYSLALELDKEERHEESLDRLDGLMSDSPPYLPAFLMAAQQLVRLDRGETACEVLKRGVETAQKQGEDHAAAEMTELLASLT